MAFIPDPDTGDFTYQDEAAPPLAPPAPTPVGHYDNLADGALSEPVASNLAVTLLDLVKNDDASRSEWRRQVAETYKLLGVGSESSPDGSDENRTDTSNHPLLITALTRFQSRALAALLPQGSAACVADPVDNYSDIEDEDRREQLRRRAAGAAERAQSFYNHYLLGMIPNYEEDTDVLLNCMGLQGIGVRKIVVDRSKQRTPVQPRLVAPENLIVSYDARNLRVGRVAERIWLDNTEMIRHIRSGTYRATGNLATEEPQIGEVAAVADEIFGVIRPTGSGDMGHTLYEVQVFLALDDDPHPLGLPRPYIVTIHETTQEILSLRRNWDPSDPDEEPLEHYAFYAYFAGSDPTRPLGLGHLLANQTRALRDVQRHLVDAGYLQNHPSGFKLGTLGIRDDASEVPFGGFVDVDSPVTDIRSAIMPHTFQGPSPGLMQLMDKMEANGRDLGGLVTIDIASLMQAGVTAAPAMAAYEESSVFQSAVHRRLYLAHKTELSIIHARMKEALAGRSFSYGEGKTLRPGDLDMVRILPVMPPGLVSREQQVLRAQSIFDFANEHPDLVDRYEAGKEFLLALNSSTAVSHMLPPPSEQEPPEPADPVTEYGMILRGQAVRAGPQQNHRAHIQAHEAQLRALATSSLPPEAGDAASAALGAHIADHMAVEAQVIVATALNIPVDQLGPGMPPELEAQIAPQVAEVVVQLETERARLGQPQTSTRVDEIRAKGDVDAQLELMEQQHALQIARLKHQQALELQAMKDEGQMQREIADNEAALDIAELRAAGRSSAGAGARAGVGASAGARTDADR